MTRGTLPLLSVALTLTERVMSCHLEEIGGMRGSVERNKSKGGQDGMGSERKHLDRRVEVTAVSSPASFHH